MNNGSPFRIIDSELEIFLQLYKKSIKILSTSFLFEFAHTKSFLTTNHLLSVFMYMYSALSAARLHNGPEGAGQYILHLRGHDHLPGDPQCQSSHGRLAE